jgi:hypothetical protein
VLSALLLRAPSAPPDARAAPISRVASIGITVGDMDRALAGHGLLISEARGQ